jgi:hypothetical protein
MIADSENFAKYQNNFFQALFEENLIEIANMYQNQILSPWKFYAPGGYTGKNDLIFQLSIKLYL